MVDEKGTEALKFRDKVIDNITGTPKFKITITFPETVLKTFTEFAKKESADCYWLAIKQLLDFHREQTEGDLKTVMVMKFVQELKDEIEDVDRRLIVLETPKKPEFKTFGQPKEEK